MTQPLNEASAAASAGHFYLQYRGFDYVAFYNGAYENANSLPTLVETGANSIEATLDYGIDAQTSQVVADPNYTDSLSALGSTIAQAESLGLSVMVRPLIDFLNPAESAPYSVGDWRQDYHPTNVAAFFASYQQMIVAEAKVAQANGAQMLSIGAELDQLTGPQYLHYWTEIIDAVRAVFSGALTYSASWNTANEVSFWSQLNYEGIDCYVPLSNAAHPTLRQLVDGWLDPASPTQDPGAYSEIGNQSPIQYFENLSAESGKPLIFTELGYANDSGAAAAPAASGNSPDPQPAGEALPGVFRRLGSDPAVRLSSAPISGSGTRMAAPNVGPGIDSFSPQNSPAQHQAKLGFENAGGLGSSFDAAPDVAQSVANGTFLFKEANATETPTVAVMPHDGGAGFIGHFAAAAGDAANDHLSVGWHFEANTAAVSQTMIQSYAVTVAEPGPHGPTATRAISVTIGGQRSDTFVFKPGFGTDFIANATAANKIELDGFSSVTSLHELRMLLSEAQNGQSESLFHVTMATIR